MKNCIEHEVIEEYIRDHGVSNIAIMVHDNAGNDKQQLETRHGPVEVKRTKYMNETKAVVLHKGSDRNKYKMFNIHEIEDML